MRAERAWVRLSPSGRPLNLLSPDPLAWQHADLAVGLSRTYRWGGHSAWDLPLSVAQHSLTVLAICRTSQGPVLSNAEQLRELLHDADEGFLSFDCITPVKPHLGEGYASLVDRLQAAIASRAGCRICAELWGNGRAPKQFEDYARRYPPLAHGAKRHLTMPWTPGLTLDEVAQKAKCDRARVQRAVATGMLDATKHGRTKYVTKTDATRWITRKCPVGAREASWISLPTAEKLYLFSNKQLKQFIAAKKLKTKIGTAGAQRGILYVAKDQCSRLRQSIGFSEQEAARRVGVTVARLRELLNGVNWRKSSAIPLVTVQAVIKRRQSQPGYTFEQAAEILGKPVSWIEARQGDGTIRVLRTKWVPSRIYLSEPMMTRLRKFAEPQQGAEKLSAKWLRLSDAAFEAGVTTSTIIKWAETGALDRRQSNNVSRYHRDHVRAQARLYWQTVRFHRAIPPDWLQAEQLARQAAELTRKESQVSAQIGPS